jgi:two-component system chemotaxis response regulator CheY
MANLKMKILVVDDFSTMRRIIKNILRQLGYENIVEADDGSAAVEVLKSEKIDFIISDWNMPHMPGIELLKTVRSNEEWKNTPFLMVTAEGQKDNVIEAVKYKVNNYIVKPFTPETLMEKINKIFETKS